MKTRVVAGLTMTLAILGMVMWGSGTVVASSSPPVDVAIESTEEGIVFTYHTVTVTILQRGDDFKLTYYLGDGSSITWFLRFNQEGSWYSADGEHWKKGPTVPTAAADRLTGPTADADRILRLAVSPSFFGLESTTFYWDSVRFVKGFPYLYGHPDRNYYQIYSQLDWLKYGYRLLHYQFGSNFVGTLGTLGPTLVGLIIGAAIGSIVPGPGTLIGAIVGAVLGTILTYIGYVVWVDEAGATWWWVNKSLLTALANIPWWLWWCGPCLTAIVWDNTDYVRVGSTTFLNYLGISDP